MTHKHPVNPSILGQNPGARARRPWAALGMLALALVALAGPAYAAGGEIEAACNCAAHADILARFDAAKPVSDPANGALSLAQAKFYLEGAETNAQRGIEADAARYQALGEFYLAQAAGVALARFHAAKPVADPANGAMSLSEAGFYLAQYGAQLAAADCTPLPEALARFHRAKPVADPLNGALSLAQAEFYVAQYGADGNRMLVQAGASELLCDLDSGTGMP